MRIQNLHPELDFIAMINADGGISFRTQKDGIDLSDIAQELGGGGHPKASGVLIDDDAKNHFVEELFKGAHKIDAEN